MKNRLAILLPNFQQNLSILFFRLFQKTQTFGNRSFSSSLRNPQFPKLPKNYATIAIILVLMIFSYYLGGKLNNAQTTIAGTPAKSPEIKKQKILNKELIVPLKNGKGEEISKLSYKIVSAELQDTFIAKGRPWKAVQGRQFLMLTVSITNKHTQGVKIFSRDYVRLVLPGLPKPLAPDFHNDGDSGIEVQAISTEPTRLGFAVDANESKFTLELGEIKGKKESINLQF